MSTSFYVYEKPFKYARTCEYCKRGMNEGYLHEDTSMTFCMVYCAIRIFGQDAAASGLLRGEIFWTDWHDEAEG